MERNLPIEDQSSAERTPPGNPEGVSKEHIVEEKDTLPEIAGKYGVSEEELIAANKDLNDRSELLKPGTRISIPRKKGG